MIPDSSNTERKPSDPVPDPSSKYDRRVAWEYKNDADFDGPILPKLELAPLDLVWSGIVLAAGFYPIVFGGFVAMYTALAFGFGDLSFDGVSTIVFILTGGFIVGLLYGSIMSIPAFFTTQLLRWGFNGIISDRGVSGIYGGMTGFLCITGGGVFIAGGMPNLRSWQQWLPWLLPLLLAVVMGHFGAILTGYRKRNVGFPFYEPIFSFEKQITIGYLMKLTFIVAGLSVVFKAAGTAGLYIGITWLVYLLVQTFLLLCDHWLVRWLRPR